jgi:hypothetical protein
LAAGNIKTVCWRQATLNRAEHYPHGLRDRQDTPETTGHITDKTLHGKWLAVIYIALGDNKTHYLRSGDNAKRNKQE